MSGPASSRFDRETRLRLRRVWLGLLSYLMFLVPMCIAVLAGSSSMDWWGVAGFTGVAVSVNLLALLAIYERSRDWTQAKRIAQRLEIAEQGSFTTRLAHYLCEEAEQAQRSGDTTLAARQALLEQHAARLHERIQRDHEHLDALRAKIALYGQQTSA